MPEAFDVAIVLGAKLRPDGSPSPALIRRVSHAAAMHRDGLAPRLLLSGGIVGGPWSEAEAMRRLLVAGGAAPDRLLLEDRSRNTVENAVFSLRLLAGTGARRLAVVSDAWHLPRALLIFRRLGADPTGFAPPPPSRLGHFRGLARDAAAVPLSLWRLRRLKPHRQ